MLSTTHSSVVVKELEKIAIRMVRDVSSKVESVREGLLETRQWMKLISCYMEMFLKSTTMNCMLA